MPLTKAELEKASQLANSAGRNWKQISRILGNTNDLIDQFEEDGEPLTGAQITARKNRMNALRTAAKSDIAALDALIQD